MAFERKLLFSAICLRMKRNITPHLMSVRRTVISDEYFPRLTPYNHSNIVKARYEINLDSINHGLKNFNEVIGMIGN